MIGSFNNEGKRFAAQFNFGGCYVTDSLQHITENIKMYNLPIDLKTSDVSGTVFDDCAILTVSSPPEYLQILVTSESDISALDEVFGDDWDELRVAIVDMKEKTTQLESGITLGDVLRLWQTKANRRWYLK